MSPRFRRNGVLLLGTWFAVSFFSWFAFAQSASPKLDPATVARGKYLTKIAGCNDCHTAGYLPSNGLVPQEQWLMGDQLGWRGPWGTTYASNLRIFMAALSEDDWVQAARKLQTRPPMPWFTLNIMEESDLRAIYQFVRSLGPVGEPAPAYLAPGEVPQGPYAQFPSPPPGH